MPKWLAKAPALSGPVLLAAGFAILVVAGLGFPSGRVDESLFALGIVIISVGGAVFWMRTSNIKRIDPQFRFAIKAGLSAIACIIVGIVFIYLTSAVFLAIFSYDSFSQSNSGISIIIFSFWFLFFVALIITGNKLKSYIRVMRDPSHIPIPNFNSFFLENNPSGDVERQVHLTAYRLLAEQGRHRTYAMINLGIGFFLVMVTLVLISGLSSDIGERVEYNTQGIDLVGDCNSLKYPRQQSTNAYTGVEPTMDLVSQETLIVRKIACLQSAIPVMTNIKKLQKSSDGNVKQLPFLQRLSPFELYGMATRLLLVILAQALTFFFLRLYVGNLTDARYFANEISNFEAKLVALQAATQIEDKAAIADMAKSIAKTERNVVLAKDKRPLFRSEPPPTRDLVEVLASLRDVLKKGP